MNPGARAQPVSGLLRLDDFSALRVSGEDRVEFLQGQLTQDVGKVTPSQAAPAAWCNRQGRVLCLMVAVGWQDAIFLILPAEMAETCMSGLGRLRPARQRCGLNAGTRPPGTRAYTPARLAGTGTL